MPHTYRPLLRDRMRRRFEQAEQKSSAAAVESESEPAESNIASPAEGETRVSAGPHPQLRHDSSGGPG